MMRRTEGTCVPGHFPADRPPRGGMDAEDLEVLVEGRRRHDRGHPFCDHRFSGTGRADHQRGGAYSAVAIRCIPYIMSSPPHQMPHARRPRAYSYLRFSRPEQIRGDSLRRQTELSERYARENGLELDATLEDRGVSA